MCVGAGDGAAGLVPGTLGVLCLAPPRRSFGTVPLATPGSSPFSPPPEDFASLSLEATSEAVFGPFTAPPSLPAGLTIYQQAFATPGKRKSISTEPGPFPPLRPLRRP